MSADRWILVFGSALALAGVALLIWALRGDRARGRRRCPRCWYDMSGTSGLACPECGRAGRSESALLRPRRRWRVAAAGAVIFTLGLTTTALPSILRDGWVDAAPIPVLRIVTWPFLGEAERAFNKRHAPAMLGGAPPAMTSWERLLVARHADRVVAKYLGRPTSPEESFELSMAWQFLISHPSEARIAAGTLRRLITEGRVGRNAIADTLQLLGRVGQAREQDVAWALAHEDTTVRRVGVRLAAALPSTGEEAVEVLLTLFQTSEHEDIRVTAVELLGTFQEHAELFRPALEEAETSDRSAAVRISAGLALDGDSNPRPSSFAAAMRDSWPPEKRAEFARDAGVDAENTRSLLPIVIGLLDDPAPEVRLAAVEAMVAYRSVGRHGLDMLRRMGEKDEDPRVRAATKDALSSVRRSPME